MYSTVSAQDHIMCFMSSSLLTVCAEMYLYLHGTDLNMHAATIGIA